MSIRPKDIADPSPREASNGPGGAEASRKGESRPAYDEPEHPELAVVIPCYNEAWRLDPFFEVIRNNPQLTWEWIFVDDGSTDGTSDCVSAFSESIPAEVRLLTHPTNKGKGAAVRKGILAARSQFVGFVDADLSASPLDFRRFLPQDDIRTGSTLLAGKRSRTDGVELQRYVHRHVMGRVFQRLVRLITGLAVYDSQCGFKLVQTRKAGRIAEMLTCDGFAFDVEFLLLAKLLGMNIREEPISWRESRSTSIRPHHILFMLLEIIRIRRRILALERENPGSLST